MGWCIRLDYVLDVSTSLLLSLFRLPRLYIKYLKQQLCKATSSLEHVGVICKPFVKYPFFYKKRVSESSENSSSWNSILTKTRGKILTKCKIMEHFFVNSVDDESEQIFAVLIKAYGRLHSKILVTSI